MPPTTDPVPPDARPPTPRTVLYVEDHPVNVLLMESVFSRRPHLRLVVATTGEDGWLAAHEARPELLLLDLNLPDCHGTELLLRLREDAALAGVPAVAVTADAAAEVGWAGFLEVWRKPMDVHAMLARLDALLPPAAPAPGTAVAVAGGWPVPPGRSCPAPASIPFSSLAED